MSEDFEIEIPPTFEHLAMVRSVLSTALEADPAKRRGNVAALGSLLLEIHDHLP